MGRRKEEAQDQIQHQRAQLVNLFQEERAANLARHEAINARLDAHEGFSKFKGDVEATEKSSHNRGWKRDLKSYDIWELEFGFYDGMNLDDPYTSGRLILAL
ncbi:hypothetical protein RND71_011590 [Anisodus tanguticus]|uniref:Uncharacterized protein n=1 Tax=Anisodus tanguticus TaxID=243964 RepID=A0AAE1SBS3_9SOLA|nr:hypothetical protein RND71_011590 [Anisodus tanguticus]